MKTETAQLIQMLYLFKFKLQCENQVKLRHFLGSQEILKRKNKANLMLFLDIFRI